MNALLHFRSSETNNGALKTKPVPRRVHKLAEVKINNEVNTGAILEKSSGDQMSETLIILQKDDSKVQVEMPIMDVKSTVGIKEVINLIVDTDKKSDGECVVGKVSDEKAKVKTAYYSYETVGDELQDNNCDMKKIIHESTLDYLTETEIAAEDVPLLDFSLEKYNAVDEAKTDIVTVDNMIVGARMCKKQKENNVLTEVELQHTMKISEVDHNDPLTACSVSSQTKVDEKQGKIESTGKVCFLIKYLKQILERLFFKFLK